MNKRHAQFLHREFGLLIYDIAEQVRAWMTGTTRAYLFLIYGHLCPFDNGQITG